MVKYENVVDSSLYGTYHPGVNKRNQQAEGFEDLDFTQTEQRI